MAGKQAKNKGNPYPELPYTLLYIVAEKNRNHTC